MGKHRTSASLGHPNQYTSPASSEPMPEPENIYTNVESLERRVSTLEGLLNDVMHQIDKPVKNQSFGNGGLPSKAKPHKKGKPKPNTGGNGKPDKPKPTPKQPSAVSRQPSAVETGCEKLVLDFLSPGKEVEYRKFYQEMPDHKYSKKRVRRTCQALNEAGKVVLTNKEIDEKVVCYISSAK